MISRERIRKRNLKLKHLRKIAKAGDYNDWSRYKRQSKYWYVRYAAAWNENESVNYHYIDNQRFGCWSDTGDVCLIFKNRDYYYGRKTVLSGSRDIRGNVFPKYKFINTVISRSWPYASYFSRYLRKAYYNNNAGFKETLRKKYDSYVNSKDKLKSSIWFYENVYLDWGNYKQYNRLPKNKDIAEGLELYYDELDF